ncbi:unnamed protein product [Cladocopium goreaui]|uniref:Uncharacterized protein n=1 Tax=Cladocopium goreaui TaxID=2562237 RepID=A0A9P1FG88_9DINO|nr:unnamed protein product [Cladocopium goreaui]
MKAADSDFDWSEKSMAKKRAKLVKQLEECHNKAWDIVNNFMVNNVQMFCGTALNGISTIMPEVSSWVTSTLNDVAEVRDSSDHLVVLWANLPTCGIISAAKLDFVISFLTNQLEKHKRNGAALIIHPNRAAQAHAAKTRESVYGKRDGALQGLALIYKDKGNAVRFTPGWKTGVIREVEMLARSDMFKPDASMGGRPHLGRAFTDIQEMKQEIADGNRMMCGSMMVDGQSDSLVTRVANEVYNSCRNHTLDLPNFPQFDPILDALKQGSDDVQQKPFQVCRHVGGSLVVLQAYAQKWLDLEQTQCRAHDIVSKHNEKYNPDGVFVATERTEEDDGNERPAKRIKEASECMQDSAGRWFPFRVKLDTVFVLKKKNLPEHVGKLDVVEQPTTFAHLLRALEVNLGLSHHKLSPGAPVSVESEKPIIFLMDDPKDDPEVEEEKPKKKKKNKRNSKGAKSKDITFKNFGAGVSVSTLKQGSKLEIAWRARPVAVLAGALAIGEQTVRLLDHHLPPRPTSSEESSPADKEKNQTGQKQPKKPRKETKQSKKKTKKQFEEEEEDDEDVDADHQHVLDEEDDDDGDLDGLGDLLGQSLNIVHCHLNPLSGLASFGSPAEF